MPTAVGGAPFGCGSHAAWFALHSALEVAAEFAGLSALESECHAIIAGAAIVDNQRF